MRLQIFFQQLTRIRLENAAELLSKEGLSVCQAANLCGFESVSFFSRKFKQIMGRSPREYKDGLF
jgi:transcriptional regulator GlxA family with amidase domain